METVQNLNRGISVPDKYYSSLTRTFSPIVLESLVDSGYSKYLGEVLTTSGIIGQIDLDMTLGDFLDWLYSKMSRHYRNEYVYKNAIANKILLGKHSLNTSYMLTEFRVESCRADVVILNGTSNVYEIKSEYDSLDRIQNQVKSYMKMFDMVNVITSSSQLSKVSSELPGEIGLLELTLNYTIRTVRESTSLRKRVKPEVIFDSLRKSEYLKIIKRKFGFVPNAPNTRIYGECKELFCRLSPEIAHDEMVKVLKQRGNKTILKDIISYIPPSLIAYIIDSQFNDNRAKKFEEMLGKKLSTIIIPD
ncbi:MAG: hypothetical protein A2169_00515 [Deltaproteobacteria bacterium RBG_13_47_9]|nr:MAG: hypothetical protein A2169_00515 [Deltaproteobacteria bacterium RBG_13_47_9]